MIMGGNPLSMRRSDTSLGGPACAFPETEWGLVRKLGASETAGFRAGVETLCRSYWKPIYRYLRSVSGRSNEDAKDLTQSFLAWALQGEAIRRYLPQRGSFRDYVKVLLRRFVRDQEEKASALKRGGGSGHRSLEAAGAGDSGPASARTSPEEELDREWAKEIAARALEAVRGRLSRDGRGSWFRAYELYELHPSALNPTYSAVAQELGCGEPDVRNRLSAVREEIRSEIRAVLSRTVTDARSLEKEWNELF